MVREQKKHEVYTPPCTKFATEATKEGHIIYFVAGLAVWTWRTPTLDQEILNGFLTHHVEFVYDRYNAHK